MGLLLLLFSDYRQQVGRPAPEESSTSIMTAINFLANTSHHMVQTHDVVLSDSSLHYHSAYKLSPHPQAAVMCKWVVTKNILNMKIIIAAFILLHGLIHVMGFAKAFGYGEIKQLRLPISQPAGLVWMITACLFIGTVALYILKKEYWWMLAVPALIISQVIIVMSWKDAKFGTIANILILIAAIISWGSSRFENIYRKDVTENLRNNNIITGELLTETDLLHLPLAVQHYLQYAGVIGKPKVKNMRVAMDVQMREKGKDFFTASAEQYNFFGEPARLFFMKANMFGTTVPGYHHYQNAQAVMDIRFAGLFTLVKKEGGIMNKAETVTLFNDMCLMAPATLIDKRIQWETVDNRSVKAVFTNHGISISAMLYFNKQGQLINFISNDRTEVNSMKSYPFSTPVHSYKNVQSYNLFDQGDAVWQYPDGDFVYGKFTLKDITYNVIQ